MRYYAEPLWTSYAILQGSIPDVSTHGYISLDSMVIDVSDVFEGYLREVLRDKTKGTDLQIIDGNQRGNQKPFFTGNAIFKVKPDIIVERRGEVLAILDSKYKPSVKEQDRYEMLAFLDATNAKNSAFICPRTDGAEPSHFLGTTRGGKRMGIIRFNMSSDDIPAEEEKLYQSMLKVVAGRYNL